MQGIGNGAGSDGIEPRSRVMARAAATICSRVNRQAGGMGHLLSATCVAQRVLLLLQTKSPCVKGKFAIYSCFFSKASHFLHADVMLGG